MSYLKGHVLSESMSVLFSLTASAGEDLDWRPVSFSERALTSLRVGCVSSEQNNLCFVFPGIGVLKHEIEPLLAW